MAECSTSELCAHRRPKITLLHLFTDLSRKEILSHSSEYLQGYYNKCRRVNFGLLCAFTVYIYIYCSFQNVFAMGFGHFQRLNMD